MTAPEEEPRAVAERVIWVDAHGQVTDDKDLAAGGEIIETLADGSTRSTVFTLGDQGRTPFDGD